MGLRHSKEPQPAAVGAAAPAVGQEQRQQPARRGSRGREEAPPDLLLFLDTAPGVRWLAGILLDLPEHAQNLRATTLAEVNSFVIAKYSQFKTSEIGHRMIRSPQATHAARQDTLALPVYIIEDLVRQRLKHNITGHYFATGVYLATRAPLMCAAVHLAKHLVKRLVVRRHQGGRHRRLAAALTFVLDQLLPTAFYGPLLTYGLLMRKLMAELDDG